jgi:hypothetical protein
MAQTFYITLNVHTRVIVEGSCKEILKHDFGTEPHPVHKIVKKSAQAALTYALEHARNRGFDERFDLTLTHHPLRNIATVVVEAIE